MQRILHGKSGEWLWFRERGPVSQGRIDLYSADADVSASDCFSSRMLAGPGGLLAESGAQGCAAWAEDGDLAFGFVSENEVLFCLGSPIDTGIEWRISERIPLPPGTERLLGTVRAVGGKGFALPWSVQRKGGASVMGMTLGTPGKWRTIILHEGRGAFAPFLLCEDNEKFHLAWAQADERVYYLHAAWGDVEESSVPSPTLAAFDGRQPVLTGAGKDVLLVYESHYSYPQSVIVRSGRCPVPQRRVASPVLQDDPRFAYAICQGLQLAKDHEGVPTLFFVERYRRQLFYTRWLGENWGPILSLPALGSHDPRSNESYLAPANLAFEETPAPGYCELGGFVQAENESAPPKFLRYRPVEIACQEVLFLDCRELSFVGGLELRVNKGKKAKENPLIIRGAAGSFNRVRAVNGGSFLKTKDGWHALFRGIAINQHEIGFAWWDALITGCARSADGLDWRFPALGFRQEEGFQNVIPGLPGQYSVLYDPDEADPGFRFKSIYFSIAGEKEIQAQEGDYDCLENNIPGWFLYSADGVRWNRRPISLNCPGGEWFEHCPMCLVRDPADPDRLWKSYGYASLTLGRRCCSLATSPDLIRWTLQEVAALPPERHGYPWVPAGPESQVHGMIVQRVGAYYLALVQYQRDVARSWIELAVSRDGRHFDPLKAGHPLIERGQPGAWDDGMLIPLNFWPEPDGWRVYYNGFNLPPPGENTSASVGVATFPPQGFTALELREDVQAGTVKTVSFSLPAGRRYALLVSASGTEFQAEILNRNGLQIHLSNWMRASGEKVAATWQGQPFFSVAEKDLRIAISVRRSEGQTSTRLYSMEIQEFGEAI